MATASEFPKTIPFRTLGPLSGAVLGALVLLVLIGVAAVFLGAGAEPERVWNALLSNWLFWSSVAMGMVMFAVALHVTSADWAWSVRRFALGGAAFLPISLLLLPVVLFGGYEHYFHHWLHAPGDPVIEAKRAWLNWPGLAIRDIVAVVILYGLAMAFAYFSLRPDVYGAGRDDRQRSLYARLTGGWRGAAEEAHRSKRILAPLGPILGLAYAFLWAIVAIDMAMSLEPHWFSTMFPVAFFMAAFHAGIAMTAVLMTVLRPRLDLENFITARQYHDLGKLVFAFSVFWMYLNWSQYIVIWYGLLPWEQPWFVHRFQEPFGTVAMAVVLLVFVVPFFGLLTKPPKTVPAILAFFGLLILTGHWLERYLLVYPSLYEGETLPLGLTEVGVGLGFLGLFLAAYLWFVRSFPMLPSPATLAAQDSAVVAVPVGAER